MLFYLTGDQWVSRKRPPWLPRSPRQGKENITLPLVFSPTNLRIFTANAPFQTPTPIGFTWVFEQQVENCINLNIFTFITIWPIWAPLLNGGYFSIVFRPQIVLRLLYSAIFIIIFPRLFDLKHALKYKELYTGRRKQNGIVLIRISRCVAKDLYSFCFIIISFYMHIS